MKIWLFGDSFGASTHSNSWASKFDLVNKASNGSSEYRIYRTYQDNKHLIGPTDTVIFCHTSESRIYLKDDKELNSRKLNSHPNCDIIFSDVYSKKEQEYIDILETIWDDRYFNDQYYLIVNELKRVPNSIHITFFENNQITSLYDIWQQNKGDINHMSIKGNELVEKFVKTKLNRFTRLVSFGASMAYGQGLDDITQAYPYLMADKLNCECVNTAKPGASNLEILHDILNYKFQEGDVAILMWAPCNRDYIFGKTNQSIGVWQETDLVKNWVQTHDDYDLTTRTWYHIQHAILYLEQNNIPYYNFAGYARPINIYKPSYMNIELTDSGIDSFKRITENASDGHPGKEAHIMVAERLLTFIK